MADSERSFGVALERLGYGADLIHLTGRIGTFTA